MLSIEGKENIEQGTIPVFEDSKNKRSIKWQFVLTDISVCLNSTCLFRRNRMFPHKNLKKLGIWGGGTDKQPNCECKPNESKKAFIEQGGIKPNHILSSRIQQIGKNLLPYQRYWLLTERIDYKSIPYERKHAFTKDTPKYILF